MNYVCCTFALTFIFLLSSCTPTSEDTGQAGSSNGGDDNNHSFPLPVGLAQLKAFSISDCSQTDEMPVNVESASIDIIKVRMREENGSWVSSELSEAPINFDLANLGCSIWSNFKKFAPPPGTYNHMRLETVESGLVTHFDGDEFSLTVPSGEQTGIKIFFDPPVVVSEDKVTVCILKYDRSKSIQGIPKNNPTRYHFKPVVKAECSEPLDVPFDDDEEGGSSSSSEGSSSSSSESSEGSSSSACDPLESEAMDPGYGCLLNYTVIEGEEESDPIILNPE